MHPTRTVKDNFFTMVVKKSNEPQDFNNKELIKEIFESEFKFKLDPSLRR